MRKQILLLVLLSSVLPELFTGSSSIALFLNPGHLAILLVGYGLAVLLIREISVRNNLSFKGIYFLGIAFGIFNEGFLAKTLIKVTELPSPQYNYYGYFLGVSFPFTIAISFWHALASVLIPILIVYWLYPESSKVPWLGKKLTVGLTIALLIFGSLSLLGESIVKGNALQLIVLLLLMLILFYISKHLNHNNEQEEVSNKISLKPVWLGMSTFFPYFLVLNYIAGVKLSLFIFFIIFALIIGTYFQILKRNGWLTLKGLLLFGIGVYLQNIILGVFLGLMFPATIIERVITSIVSIFILIWFAKKVSRSTNYVIANSNQ